jgi:hypothetical protein
MSYGKCRVCGSPATSEYSYSRDREGPFHWVGCERCIRFFMTEDAYSELEDNPLKPTEVPVVSHYLAHTRGTPLTRDVLARVRRTPLPSVSERADRLLQWMAEQNGLPGALIAVPEESPKLLGLVHAFDPIDFRYLFFDYLLPKGFIDSASPGSPDFQARITPDGWAHLDTLTKRDLYSSTGFIAMSFRDELKPLELALREAIRIAGYRPIRSDDEPKDDHIMNQILAEIRASRFVVADFTHQPGGVYFEAGFARGLGITVFRSCIKAQEKQLHFDIAQFPFHFWSDDNLEQLTKDIHDDIRANIGQGPEPVGQGPSI